MSETPGTDIGRKVEETASHPMSIWAAIALVGGGPLALDLVRPSDLETLESRIVALETNRDLDHERDHQYVGCVTARIDCSWMKDLAEDMEAVEN